MMEQYVDGFVIVLPKKNVKAYQKMSAKAGKVWMEYGALQYVECAGDDLKTMKEITSFPELGKSKKDETVIFSFIVYKSKQQRDEVNKKVMTDKRILKAMKDPMLFEMKKMTYGGFKTIVNYKR